MPVRYWPNCSVIIFNQGGGCFCLEMDLPDVSRFMVFTAIFAILMAQTVFAQSNQDIAKELQRYAPSLRSARTLV